MPENYLTAEDEADVRDAIQSVLSNTFGRHPFTLITKTVVPDTYGGSDAETPVSTLLEGLVSTAATLLEENPATPVDLQSDAVLVLSADYLDVEGVLDDFAPDRARSSIVVLDDVRHRISRCERTAQFGEDPLVVFVSLKKE